ncbi:MAG: DMT superfamily drug/metabolite permease [Candidatus Pacebacteria bacterium GW2011_GWB1_47_8]|nr:MAG: DMT superfamily drug/metabolite permease [Candidatus Pacebacteria bacterium GW2011_GWA1_46_10]KKU84259.1 MAG: DMT superfamily drug/metabolite permease [Candidatus Pacebacteria bacterium GW2011_GWB1_47_8]
MKNKQVMGPMLIAAAAALWAFDGIIRRSLYTLEPIVIVFYEHLVGTVILLPTLFKTVWTDVRKIWRSLAFVSVFSGLLGTLWFTAALLAVQFIPFSVVFLLQKLQPIFAIGSARVILKEQFSKDYLKWAALALIAAYFVTFPTGRILLAQQGNNVIAALYALGAAFGWGVSTTFSKKMLKVLPSQQSTAVRFVATTGVTLLVLLATLGLGGLAVPTISQWGRFIFIALSTGMVALMIYYRGLKTTPVRVSTIMELVFPLLAVFIDAVVYRTILAPTQYAAAAVLLLAAARVAKTVENRQQVVEG